MDVKPKDTEAAKKRAAANAKRERLIANQWREFSQTEAYKDLMEYGKGTSDMLTSYAKERVMPSPVNNTEQLIIDGETAGSLLQNARGCDIVITYVEEYVNSTT
jgi:hypothetical protein